MQLLLQIELSSIKTSKVVIASLTNDWQVSYNFLYFVDFEVVTGTNFLGDAFEDWSTADKICEVTTNRRK